MNSNINEVINYVEHYRNAMNKGIDEGIKKLTEQAFEIVKQYCASNNLSSHLNNISMDYDPINKIGTVFTSDEVIIFKEMGTGIVGSKNPHPSPNSEFASWTYDINEHGEKGWKYPKEDGTYGWTKGLPAGSMFYNTFNDIKQYVDSTVSVEVHKSTNNIY